MDKLRIISLNARGLQGVEKRRSFFTFLKELRADIICLTETHAEKSDIKLWSREWGTPIFASSLNSRSCGVAILLPKARKLQMHSVMEDDEGRYLIVKASVNEIFFALCVLYAPNSASEPFFQNVFEKIEMLDYADIMMLGDFNCTLDPHLDRTSNKKYESRAETCLKAFMCKHDISDVWRDKFPFERVYSWSRPTPFAASHIDLMLCNNTHCEEIDYFANIFSDHKYIQAQFNFETHPRGPGYWKFNSLLLADEKYTNMIRELIQSRSWTLEGAHIFDIWERIKLDICKVTKVYSKNKVQESRKDLENLKYTLNMLQNKFEKEPGNQNLLKAVESTAIKIGDFYEAKTRARMFRAKAKWEWEGDKSSKYFLSLERSNYNKKTMISIKNDQNKLVSNPVEVMEGTRKVLSKSVHSCESSTV